MNQETIQLLMAINSLQMACDEMSSVLQGLIDNQDQRVINFHGHINDALLHIGPLLDKLVTNSETIKLTGEERCLNNVKSA